MMEHEVGVAAALAEAVDGALHLRAPACDRGQRVGHADLAVVVRVDAERRWPASAASPSATIARDLLGRLPPLVSQSTMHVGAARPRPLQRLRGRSRGSAL